MIKFYRKSLTFLLIFAAAGQLVFLIVSPKYTKPHFDNKIFATTGIVFDGADLSKLTEGAHYFGQTAIGWTKFPNFRNDLMKFADLPADSSINMHAQERQNFIFTITSSQAIEFSKLEKAKDFLQAKFDEYNKNTKTKFILTNIDYSQEEIRKTYAFGGLLTLLLSIASALALLFINNEFFPPRLKL